MHKSDVSRRRRKNSQFLPISCMFIMTILPGFSNAQDIPSSRTPTAVTASTTSIPPTYTRPATFMITSFTSAASTNSSAAATSRATKDNDPPSGIFTPPADSADHTYDRKEGVFNYYFLFLAVFGLLVAMFLWWIHRRRKRRKEQMRLSGQHALARDLDGWVNTRRWMHGGWRHNQTGFVRREEGLDERGEAPPPYEPKSESSAGLSGLSSTRLPPADVPIPLRTLQREGSDRLHPPEYVEALGNGNNPSARPESVNSQTTRPDTAHLDTAGPRPTSSTRQLLPHERIEQRG